MQLHERLLRLCQIPSFIGEEKQLCDLLQAELGQTALAAPIRRYENSLVVPLSRHPDRPHVALAGHLDVVRTDHDGPPRIEGDRLYGAGAADMKSGLALMLDMAHAERRPEVNLTLVFYSREEGPYAENELGVVLEQDDELRQIDIAVLLEPSDNKLQLGCGGSIHATLTFSGRTAHSARPWQGHNAIYEALPLLERLSKQAPQPTSLDGLEWFHVMTATLAHGGRARNIVPDRFDVNVNYRFGPDLDLVAAKARLLEFVGNDAGVQFVDLSPSAPPARHHPLVRELETSGVTAVEPKQAWTDVARFHDAEIVAVNFGPGVQSQAHQENEWTSVAALDVGRDILARWLGKLANRIASPR